MLTVLSDTPFRSSYDGLPSKRQQSSVAPNLSAYRKPHQSPECDLAAAQAWRNSPIACYHPLKGYRSRHQSGTGKRGITFHPSEGFIDLPIMIACGQCIGCRIERSRQWAIRCHHEASLHAQNSFVTLTYNNENLPEDGSLSIRHFQLFMKRLRKRHGTGIRFYGCGEYGDKLGRPHYHVCLFNFEPADKQLFKVHRGNRYYTSDDLDQLWGKGYTITGDVTFQSAAYVARYITKKITGLGADQHYETSDPNTGEIFQLKPEFTTMSRRPGIGKKWLDTYKSDIYDYDFVIINDRKMRAPRYYDTQYEISDAEAFELLKRKRKRAAIKHADNNTPDRLKVRETIQNRRAEMLRRNLEEPS